MSIRKPGLLKRFGAFVLGTLLLGIGTCDVQYPPSNTDTVVGVAIAPAP